MTSAPQPRLTDPRSFAFILVGTTLPILIALLVKGWAAGRGDTIAVGPLGVDVCIAGACVDGEFAKLGGGAGAFAVLSLITGFAAIAAAAVFGGLSLAHKADKLPPFVIGHAAFGAAAFAMIIFTFRIGGADEVSLSWGPLLALGGVGVGWYMLRRLQLTTPKRSAIATYQPQMASPGAMFGEAPAASAAAAPATTTATAPAAAPAASAPAMSPKPSTPGATASPPAAAAAAAAAPTAMPAVPANQPTKCPKCKGPVDYIPQYQRSWCAKCRQYA